MKWHCKLVHGSMLYTKGAWRWEQFNLAPAMEQSNSVCSQYTALVELKNAL